MASATEDAPAAAQAMPVTSEPAAAAEDPVAAEPPADGDHAGPSDASGDAAEAAADGDTGGGGADGTMPPAQGVQGAPPAFGLPDAYLPPWLQGAEGMPMPYPPFSPPYYYPYMDVAEAYDAAAAAAQGGYVGAGAFALPPSPLLTPSMIGTLLPFSPMGSMSPLSPPGAMPLPPLYALPDGGASYDPQEALAQFQAQQMMMTSPRAFGPAGPYALAPQMYDAYDTGDALPSPRQHMQAQQAFGAGRGRGLMPRTGRSGMVVPPPLPQAQQQPRAEAVAGAPAGASPPSPRAAEPSLMRAGSGGGSSSSAPAMSAMAASASSAPEGGATLRARRMGVSTSDVLSETTRGPRAARGLSPPHADGAGPRAPVAAAPSEDAAVAAVTAALTATSTAEDGAASSSEQPAADGDGGHAPLSSLGIDAPVDVAALLSARSLSVLPAAARFFVVKSYSEDDVHKAIKYGCWSSTPAGNKRLDAAFRDASAAQPPLPVLLLFSVNASGQFCGVAQLVSRVDAAASVPFWQQSAKWTGRAELRWHAVKDVPNAALRHVSVGAPPAVAAQAATMSPAALEAMAVAAARPLTNSRDTQELSYEAGIEALRIMRDFPAKTSLLGDFEWYGEREAERERLRASGAIAGGGGPKHAHGVHMASPLPVPTTPAGLPARAKGGEK